MANPQQHWPTRAFPLQGLPWPLTLACFGLAGALGCRDLNPRFGREVIALSTQAPKDTTTSPKNSQSDETLPQNPPFEPDPDFEYGHFCLEGSLLCYPILAGDPPDTPTSHGSVDPGLKLAGGNATRIIDGSHPQRQFDPLAKALSTTSEGGGIVSVSPYQHQGESIGVDLWFLPDLNKGTNWTAFEIDGVMAIYQTQPNKISCIIQGESGQATLEAPIEFKHLPLDPDKGQEELAEFVHVACSLSDTGRMQLTVGRNFDDAQKAAVQFLPKLSAAPLRLGRRGPLSKATGNFSGRIALVRTWNDLERMRHSYRNELEHICNELKLCH